MTSDTHGHHRKPWQAPYQHEHAHKHTYPVPFSHSHPHVHPDAHHHPARTVMYG